MSADDEALQRAIADACLGDGAGEALATDLRAFLASHGADPGDIEAIAAAPPRLAVYRSLVRNGIGAVALRMLPRTRAHLQAACPGRFEADLRAFAQSPGPRTHYLRDVPGELLAWAAPRWKADPAVPAYLVDLATHELTHFVVSAVASAVGSASVEGGGPREPAELSLDRSLLFADGVRVVGYGWAVHELGDPAGDASALQAPSRRDVTLLAYRDDTHAVRWLELSPLAGAILTTLAAGVALGPAVLEACAAHGVAPAPVLADIARLLAELAARGVLLGARRR